MELELNELNKEQASSAQTTEGPLLILAGAGTGKTKTLVSRIANIIKNGHAHPSEVLAVTFTNKAALEMIKRVKNIIGNADFFWVGTFHSVAAKILRINASEVNLNSNFTILDSEDQLKILKKVTQSFNFESDKNALKKFLGIIQSWKDKALTPGKVKFNISSNDFIGNQAIKCYELYQKKLIENNSVDFADLLLHNISIFNKNTEILEKYCQKFKYIMVDEYQDTNKAQYIWLKLLTTKHQNICCVGDDDQSIYGWRGAEISNILNFQKDFKDAKIVKLEQNYRSTNEILIAADSVIKKNYQRLGKKLWTNKTGEKVQILGFQDGRDEANYIIGLMQSNVYSFPLKETAILVRASFQTRLFEEACIIKKLPYIIVGGVKFYARKEIKDIIAYLNISINPEDNIAFERIVNIPKRGVGLSAIAKIYNYTQSAGCSMFKAAKHLIEVNQIKNKNLADFLSQIEIWNQEVEKFQLADFLKKLVNESGYSKMLANNDEMARIENLQELFNVAAQFDNNTDFLEHVSLVTEVDSMDNQNALKIITLHSSKGLEFEQVFLPGFEEGVFPHRRCLENPEQLEEERRLAYVGITRAKKKLVITYAKRRLMNNQWQNSTKSRFLDGL